MQPGSRRSVRLASPDGLHLRLAAAVVRMTQQFEGSIRIHKGPAIADARSVLELLALAAEPGSELVIEVTGQDAAAVLRDVAHLLEAP